MLRPQLTKQQASYLQTLLPNNIKKYIIGTTFVLVVVVMAWYLNNKVPHALTNANIFTAININSAVANTANSARLNSNEQTLETFNPTDPAYSAADTGLVECYLRAHPEDAKFFPEGIIRTVFVTNSQDAVYSSVCADTRIVTPERLARGRMLIETDADNDGLNLALENAYYTDDNKVDTDSDGYSDLEEILSGHNPIGSGSDIKVRP